MTKNFLFEIKSAVDRTLVQMRYVNIDHQKFIGFSGRFKLYFRFCKIVNQAMRYMLMLLKQLLNLWMFCLLCLPLKGQQLGQWKYYLPHRTGNTLAIVEDRIYVGTDNAFIYTYDTEDAGLGKYTALQGYAQPEVEKMAYYPDYELMIVAYENADLDLEFKDRIEYVPSIRLATIVGEKKVNDIKFYENYIYLSCSFGLMIYDIDKREVKDTYFFNFGDGNVSVKTSVIANGKIFSATDAGLYFIDVNHPNPANAANWTLWDIGEDSSERAFSVATVNDKVYGIKAKDIFEYDNDTDDWMIVYSETDYYVNKQVVEGLNEIAIVQTKTDTLGEIHDDTRIVFCDNNWQQIAIGDNPSMRRINELKFGPKGNYWAADSWNGLVEIENYDLRQIIVTNSPRNEHVWEMAFQNNEALWVAPGGVSKTESYRGWKDGVYKYEDRQWNNINTSSSPFLEGVSDIVDVKFNNAGNRVYLASFYNGLIIYEDGEFIARYDQNNSQVLPGIGDAGSSRVRALAVDADDNVWICNHLSAEPLLLYTADGQWQNLGGNFPSNEVMDIVVDNNGYKWLSTEHNGVIVYNSGDDPLNPFDDEYVNYKKGDGDLETSEIKCLAVDKDGEVWMGTEEGMYIFYCPYAVFDGGCAPTRPIVDELETGELGYLLRYEFIYDIEVDAANRKWIGTRNGLWVFDEDGKNQIHHFTPENSPLLDAEVFSVAVNDKTGEAFIGTAKGIVSFQGEAIEGLPVHQDVLVYPNPVRPNYDGVIAIKGLANDAYVKITTVSGDLVYETQALGSQAVWSGYMPNGVRAASGVYLIFSSDELGNEKFKGKFAIVR